MLFPTYISFFNRWSPSLAYPELLIFLYIVTRIEDPDHVAGFEGPYHLAGFIYHKERNKIDQARTLNAVRHLLLKITLVIYFSYFLLR